jgi:hypothetical protein
VTYETLFRAVQKLQTSPNHSRRLAIVYDSQADNKAIVKITDVSEEISITVPIIQVSRVRRLFLGVLGSTEVDDQGVATCKKMSR